MPNYRRAFVPGGCWFFTVNLLDRRRRLLTDHIDALREATRLTQTRHPLPSTPWWCCPISPCGLDAAARRCRFFVALAADQNRFCESRSQD
jgi:hypothetical protein